MSQVPATAAPGPYTWSRYAANPVEHVAGPLPWRQPICGARLAAGYQHIEDRPSGSVPLCARCQRRANQS